ncbi:MULTISPECIES: LysR family transcriptional regulator [Stenotrophomonas]|uniref:LysR family transcriptional regulator n=1 Tax=Stenotrophomonas maltophilia TaxID=40324 RepID=A0A4S2D1C0_STEMA|nr:MULTISPECIES: LysR family transcriptional regulator [Stenotrophomonas]MBD3827210.1 LysR family transcriptional regulator [Stenotrophomonas sp.]TGY35169.1 LysR family transcriptional regulator [Stenotrophomonas maltophilia]
MHLTLRQWQVFVGVADAGTTAAAGLQVALSQSATSAALNELEGQLAAPLFDRIGRRLVLNAHGRALLDPARALLVAAADLEQLAGVGRAGAAGPLPLQLRIGASTTIGNYLLPQRVAALLAANPQAEVDLRIGNSAEVVAAVQRLDVDLGVIEGPCHESGLQVLPWQRDALVIVAGGNADLPLHVDLPTLAAARWLLREPGSGTREAVEQALLPHLHHFGRAMQLGSTEAIKQAAAAGLGLACLSRHAVADLVALGTLRILDTPLPPLSRQLWVVRHPGRRVPPPLGDLLALPPEAFAHGSATR